MTELPPSETPESPRPPEPPKPAEAESTVGEESSPSDIDRRLSVLEERTKPKPKSLVEIVTQWGGVATFILALLYTFPLGVWDRFFVSPVDQERALISKLTDVDAEYYKTSQNLPPDQLFMLGMTLRAKKIALIIGERPEILRWNGSLSGGEVELLAYQAASVGDVDLAERLYKTALDKATSDKNAFLIADIMKTRAAMYAVPGTAVSNLAKARIDYNEGIAGLINVQQYLDAAMAAWDWANVENAMSDKPCAYALAQYAIQTITPIDPNRAKQYSELFEKQRALDAQANTLPTGPCSSNVVTFTSKIKPGLPPSATMNAGVVAPLLTNPNAKPAH
jgi:hypothetical protein